MKLTAVTEKQANEARDKHAEMLRQAGAHAITVDEIKREGSKTFAVIAFTEKKTTELPKALEIKKGNSVVKVPLIVKKSPKFKPE